MVNYEKQVLRQKLRDFYDDSELEGTIEQVCENLQRINDSYVQRGFRNISLKSDGGYYENTLEIWGDRLETDKEQTARIKNEELRHKQNLEIERKKAEKKFLAHQKKIDDEKKKLFELLQKYPDLREEIS